MKKSLNYFIFKCQFKSTEKSFWHRISPFNLSIVSDYLNIIKVWLF